MKFDTKTVKKALLLKPEFEPILCTLFLYFPEKLKINAMQLRRLVNEDVITLSWPRIHGYHSDVSIEQCDDDVMKTTCLSHDVTNVTELDVASGNGTLLTLTVKQDRDAVFKHPFVFEQPSDKGKYQNRYSY